MSDSITSTGAAPAAEPCPSCNGVGHIIMSLCCGRGCQTCVGDGQMEAVSCYRCSGTGLLPRQAEGTGLPQFR